MDITEKVEQLQQLASELGVEIREGALSGNINDRKAELAFKIAVQLNANISMLLEQIKVLLK